MKYNSVLPPFETVEIIKYDGIASLRSLTDKVAILSESENMGTYEVDGRLMLCYKGDCLIKEAKGRIYCLDADAVSILFEKGGEE
nr:MAG TPA: hypothetical protein [Caudoviricetes sp.]